MNRHFLSFLLLGLLPAAGAAAFGLRPPQWMLHCESLDYARCAREHASYRLGRARAETGGGPGRASESALSKPEPGPAGRAGGEASAVKPGEAPVKVESGGNLTTTGGGTVTTGPEAGGLSTFNGANELQEFGAKGAAAKAGDAFRRADLINAVSKFETRLADSIARNYDDVRNNVEPKLNSPDAATRAEAASRMNEPPRASREFADVYSEVGLRTNRDVMSNGKNFVETLAKDSDDLASNAKEWKRAGDQALRAAQEFDMYHARLNQRITNMGSVDGAVLAGQADAGGAGASRGFTGGKSENDFSGITGKGGANLGAGATDKAGRSLASISKTDGTSSISESGVDGLPSGAAGAKGESLRDLLRRKLAEGKGSGAGGEGAAGSAAGAPKSAFANFFDDGAGKSEDEKADPTDHAGRHPFMMNAAETEKTVARLMGRLGDSNGQQGGEEVFGSADVSIFQRMKTFLTRAQKDHKVAR